MFTEDQRGVQDAALAADHCNDWKMFYTDYSVGIAIEAETTQRGIHSTCRGEEQTTSVAADTAWTSLTADASQFSFDAKSALTAPSGDPAGIIQGSAQAHLTWIDAQLAKLALHETAMNAKKTAYVSAHGAYVAKHGVCNGNMGEFEGAACAKVDSVCDMCDTYGHCYTSKTAAHGSILSSANGNAGHRKVEWESMNYMICLVDVLVSADESGDRATALDACTAASHNTDDLTIIDPGFSDRLTCDRLPVSEEPCNAQFRTDEYANLFAATSYLCAACTTTCDVMPEPLEILIIEPPPPSTTQAPPPSTTQPVVAR